MIKRNLEDTGTKVVEAASDFDCIRILHQTKIDLILLDLMMPDFNGWSILNLVRITEPPCHIPVSVVSVEPPNMPLVWQFKPDDCIQKPFDIRDLLMRMDRVVNSMSTSQ